MGHLFAPGTLHEIAKRRAGLPHEEMVALIIEDLARAYPRHIETRQNWFFSLAGGATGIMTVLHGSLSEYLLLFGSPVGTEGFSGRYWLNLRSESRIFLGSYPARGSQITGCRL